MLLKGVKHIGTLNGEMKKWAKKNNVSVKQQQSNKKKNKPKSKREFTEHDWKELMGTNRPTYRRGCGGA